MMVRIAYFCRGFGYTHAVRATQVLDAMRSLAVEPPRTELVTSASGAEYLRKTAVGHTDPRWMDDKDHSWWTRRKVARLLARRAGALDLVIVDELFYVPALCAELGLPCLFMACSLAASRHFRFLRSTVGTPGTHFAIPDWPFFHPQPSDVAPYVDFIGPLVGVESCTRTEARAALGLPADATITVLVPGSPHKNKDEIRQRMLHEALAYWRANSRSSTLLVAVSDAPEKWPGGGVMWIPFSSHTRLLLRAADLVLAYGGTVALESLRAGAPTIAFTTRADWLGHARMSYLAERNAVVHRCVDDGSRRALADDVAASNELCDIDRLDLPWADPGEIALLASRLAR